VNLVGVSFTLIPITIAAATSIPNVGEQWNKGQHVGREHYEPYIKVGYHRQINRVFPFKYLQNIYAPLMKLIIKCFTYEGRFSRLYTYHVRLLMHFTRVRMMNLTYFICRNIENMALYVQKKPFPQPFNNIYHFSLIKIVVLHQLSLLNMPWDTFIVHEIFKGPQVIPSVPQQEGGPSGQPGVHETKTTGVPVYVTYERGTRRLFVAARRVLSSPGMEGVSFSSPDKRKMLSSPGVKGALPSSPTI